MIPKERYEKMKDALTDKILQMEKYHMDDLRIMHLCVKDEIDKGTNDVEFIYALVLELIQKYKDKH